MTNNSAEAKLIKDLERETHNAISARQDQRVKELLLKAELLFIQGRNHVRTLISNRYILPLSQWLEMNYSWGHKYLNLFPPQLKADYCRQINSSGI